MALGQSIQQATRWGIMRLIENHEVLRINCPGFGESSYLSANCAKPLDQYKAIVINPESILHLFDKDPDLLKQIETARSEGLTSYTCKNDKVLQSILPDLEGRIHELASFLEKGGLLVYFLCPPFLIHGGSTTIDNYYWLDLLAPDKSQDKNRRNISNAARGKNVELTSEGQASPFIAYLKQKEIEWTTLVRTEKLAEGYSVLATAGPQKCIAGLMEAGDNGGRVVFLPAPYNAEFDGRLMVGVNLWYGTQDKMVAPPPISSPAWEEDAKAQAEAPPPPPAPEPVAQAPVEEPQPVEEPVAEQPVEPEYQAAAEPEFKHEEPAYVEPQEVKAEEPAPEPYQSPEPEPISMAIDALHKPEPLPEPVAPAAASEQAKDLIGKMEEISKQAVPDWAQQYSFSDLDSLRTELKSLNEQIQSTQLKITDVEGRISSMEWLKNALLSLEDDELYRACAKVFERLGWGVKPADGNPQEAWLQDGEWTVGIARIVRTTSQAKRADLAQLAESIITYWGEHESEPKGILVASTWANRPPSERNEEDYPDALSDFAEKKHLCLMTTAQLLSIYRDLESGKASADQLRESILSTSGRLSGHALEADLAASRA